MKGRLFLLFAIVSLMLLTACKAQVEVRPSPGSGVAITVTMTEEEVNDAISGALELGGNPLLRNPQVDLQDGAVVITGEHERREGEGRVSGTIRLTLSAEDGVLVAQITDMEIEGTEVSDEQIAQLNERLAEALSNRAGRGRRVLRLDSVTVTDDSIEFVLILEREE